VAKLRPVLGHAREACGQRSGKKKLREGLSGFELFRTNKQTNKQTLSASILFFPYKITVISSYQHVEKNQI